jgi:predicted aminopeptidase
MPRYLAQATYGQFDLLKRARPVEAVLADSRTPAWVADLLAEMPSIKAYGAAHGLAVKRNYTTYSALGRTAAVWFVGAADPVSFKPRKWCFPIVGCFAGLGWFDEDDAIKHRKELEARGYDAISRPASAYSTGGWFPDPILSTMLSNDVDGFPEFANVILHESVHATVLVPDQPFFNESIASYVADAMTDQWVIDRFGQGSPEQIAWLYSQASRQVRTARMFAAYAELDKLYKSSATRQDKLAAKKRIIDELVDEMRLRRRPNNASLIELRVYQAGSGALAAAHRGCGSLRAMVQVASTMQRGDFDKELQEDLDKVSATMIAKCKSAAAGAK